jgi:hypothetical protein
LHGDDGAGGGACTWGDVGAGGSVGVGGGVGVREGVGAEGIGAALVPADRPRKGLAVMSQLLIL